ncbi:MAG: Hsp70 family protein [Reyranellaceae bacterium]
MRRTTIDFGIDLGTTNSSIAVADGHGARIIPNKLGAGITPSAVWIDKRGNLHVGDEAKRRALDDDPYNAAVEFKLRMGMAGDGMEKHFVGSDRLFTPEALSAEVLKSLRTDVRTAMDEDVQSAVITVPAAFEQPATAATQNAAMLAGITRCPLLLEPVAAALAYGFQSQQENLYWLVYDFGGGTFDAAIMRIRDGLIHVENHDGDNQLGGKLLDWDIVTERLLPAALEQFDLPDFHRGNPRWESAFGRLKLIAERGKIDVCRTRAPVEISFDNWCTDGRGRTIDFAYTLTPEDIATLTRPYLRRTLNLCRKTLRGAGLEAAAIERVLMVGGSTLNPWIRDAVQSELRCPVEHGIDPVTVVARGAAIFASTLELQAPSTSTAIQVTAWQVHTEHSPVGNLQDPDIGGRVTAPGGRDPTGFTLELVDPETNWRSGRIELGSSGVFLTRVYAATAGRHTYDIELCDPTGTPVPTEPRSLVYTFMLNLPNAQPAAQTVGIGLSNGNVAVYVKKGDSLPLAKAIDHITTKMLRAGRRDDVLRIPLLEGEYTRAVRNHGIGAIEITGADLERDLPAGSIVEVAVKMDESQQIRVHAYIRVMELDFDVVFTPVSERQSLEKLVREAEELGHRLAAARTQAEGIRTPAALEILGRIDEEDLLDTIRKLMQAAANDPDSVGMLDRRLRELAALIDQLEDALKFPRLVDKARETRADTEKLVEESGRDSDRKLLKSLAVEFQKALELQNAEMLRRNIQEYEALWWSVRDRDPAVHLARFDFCLARRDELIDPIRAERLIEQGQRAARSNDIDTLKHVNRQLIPLLRAQPTNDDLSRHLNIGDTVTSYYSA